MANFTDNPEAWGEELKQELSDITENRINTLANHWIEMGLSDSSINERKKVIIEQISKNYSKMIKEERKHLDEIIGTITKRAKERYQLYKELNRQDTSEPQLDDTNTALKALPGDETPENMPLLQVLKNVENGIAKFKMEKEERMVAITQLMKDNDESSANVGRSPLHMPRDTILIPSEMDQLREHVGKMRDLKKTRIGQLGEMQIELDHLCKVLEDEPQSEDERNVLMSDPSDVVLSDGLMKAADHFLERLQAKLNTNQAQRTAMVGKIESLCSRLGYDDFATQQFLPKDDNVHDAALLEIQTSLNELEELKQQHMAEFIAASKRELEKVWNMCFISEVQKAKFHPFHKDTVDESTLDALEKELDRLKKYHEVNLAIFSKVNEWQKAWEHVLQVEARSRDKSRLMGRKRVNLLEEEKERKGANKKLPRVENELMAFAEAYAETNQEHFQVMGMSVEDYINHAKAEHNYEVNEEKQMKKDIKKQQLYHETMYGASSAPLTPINQTAAALMKSRRDITSATKVGVSGSSSVKRPAAGGVQNDMNVTSKRRRVNATGGTGVGAGADDSIVRGNLPQHSVNSVDSMAMFKDKDIVSSTFCNETQTLPRAKKAGTGAAMTSGLRTPTSTRKGMTSSTPSKSTTSLFKTPQSLTASGSKLMRSAKGSGSTSSLSTRSNTLGTRGTRDLKKVPFKF